MAIVGTRSQIPLRAFPVKGGQGAGAGAPYQANVFLLQAVCQHRAVFLYFYKMAWDSGRGVRNGAMARSAMV